MPLATSQLDWSNLSTRLDGVQNPKHSFSFFLSFLHLTFPVLLCSFSLSSSQTIHAHFKSHSFPNMQLKLAFILTAVYLSSSALAVSATSSIKSDSTKPPLTLSFSNHSTPLKSQASSLQALPNPSALPRLTSRSVTKPQLSVSEIHHQVIQPLY